MAENFKGNTSEQGAYLGLAWLAILGWFAWSFRRVAAARFLVALLAVGVVVELGIRLNVDGRDSVSLPWRLVYRLPFFDNVLPVRISMFVALAASVCVAWWASSRRAPRTARVALTGLAIATVVPSLWLNVWHEHPYRPAFFTQGIYRTCLRPGDNVLMLPFHRTDEMLWQAESGFAFHTANGDVAPGATRGRARAGTHPSPRASHHSDRPAAAPRVGAAARRDDDHRRRTGSRSLGSATRPDGAPAAYRRRLPLRPAH